MSSAFRNFFLSFIICLLVLGYVGYQYIWPTVSSALDFDDYTTESRDPDIDMSYDDTSQDVILQNTNKDGKEVSYLFVGESSDGKIGAVIFVRADEGAETFTYCSIPVSTAVNNDVGVSVPISIYFSDADDSVIITKVASMVGYKADYFLRVGPEFVAELVNTLHNPYIELTHAITYENPKYYGVSFESQEDESETVTLPEDYYVTLPAGSNLLDPDKAKAIMTYSAENSEPSLTASLYNTLFIQFMTNSATKRNTSAISSLIRKSVSTNITSDSVAVYNNVFFTYDEGYKVTNVTYSSWSATVTAFKNAD